MKRGSLLLLLLFVAAAPVAAQGDPLNPSGSIPWAIPAIQPLNSPTPYPIRPTPTPQYGAGTPSPTPSPTASPTATPISAATEQIELATLAAQQSEMSGTLEALESEEIAGYEMATAVAEVSNYSRFFFGYVKGLDLGNIRGMGAVISFLIVALALILLTKLVTAILPMIAAAFKWVMQIVRLVVEFLPF